MLVVDERRVDPGTGSVVDAEVIELGVSSEEIASLIVHHQLLDQLGFFQHVEMETSGRFSRPEKHEKMDNNEIRNV